MLEVERTLGDGVDRSQLVRLIAMTPTERLQHAVSAARNLQAIRGALRAKSA